MFVVALVNIDISNSLTLLLSFSPHSNLYANREGRSGNPANAPAIPLYQTTPQGVNRNNNVCGMDQGWPNNDYDAWLDTQGNPMPWISQATYNSGEIIQVDSYLTAHHKGKKKENKHCIHFITDILIYTSVLICHRRRCHPCCAFSLF